MPRAMLKSPPDAGSLADLLQQLGECLPFAYPGRPRPGRAREKDVVRLRNQEERLYELVDGVLVEKVMGLLESYIAIELSWYLRSFLRQKNLGFLLGADGAVRIMPHLVRIPDMSFISWEQFPNKLVPAVPIPELAPDLAVEVLSKGNTSAEMARKLADYFQAGVLLVWYIDPDKALGNGLYGNEPIACTEGGRNTRRRRSAAGVHAAAARPVRAGGASLWQEARRRTARAASKRNEKAQGRLSLGLGCTLRRC